MKTQINGISVKRTPEQIKELQARCQAEIETTKKRYQDEIEALKFQVGTANQDELHEIINKRFAYEMAIELVENDVTENYRILYGTDVFPDDSKPVEPVGVVRHVL